ncbi:MAG TPA: hypothetical protein VHA57_12395 [Actinomycetota bacterium]|nr:hypothetical protein [Actinomycetota bacterium]
MDDDDLPELEPSAVAPSGPPVRDWRDERPPSPEKMILRSIFLRCPRCGQKGILHGYFKVPPPCPRCGVNFNPDGDAAVGWVIVNLGVTMTVFFVSAFLGLVITWPKVPWTGLTVFTIVLNGIVPFVLVPFSRTVWAAIFLLLHRMDGLMADPGF